MNITSKNRTFVLTEEQGHYAFNGELILDADDHPEFRGSVNPKQEDTSHRSTTKKQTKTMSPSASAEHKKTLCQYCWNS